MIAIWSCCDVTKIGIRQQLVGVPKLGRAGSELEAELVSAQARVLRLGGFTAFYKIYVLKME